MKVFHFASTVGGSFALASAVAVVSLALWGQGTRTPRPRVFSGPSSGLTV